MGGGGGGGGLVVGKGRNGRCGSCSHGWALGDGVELGELRNGMGSAYICMGSEGALFANGRLVWQ